MHVHVGSGRRSTLVISALMGSLVLTSCAGGSSGTGSEAGAEARITISPAGGKEVPPGSPISVKAEGGRLTEVEVKDDKGNKVDGELAGDGSTWTSDSKAGPQTTYTVRSTAKGGKKGGGKQSSSTATFSTERVEQLNKLTNTPANGQTVGTGMPVSILFDHPVDAGKRAEIEKSLEVTTQPRVEGAWGWVKDWSGQDRVDWRPKDPWPAGTKVSVKGSLAGINTGEGGWFARNYAFGFSIGADRKAVIDVPGHTLTMYENGRPVGDIKGSAGSPVDPTRGGIHTVRSKNAAETMDSATIGHGKEWMLDSQWVTHLTASGTFLHSAPWNNSLGVENNSHGCFGMTTSDAKKVYDFLPIGATVEVKGTTSTKQTDVGNGLEVWQENWQQWQKRSALK
ncbi:Ig-like domain-containing protein [Streptomyces sp. ISL-11]|uniref:L,D-transpeptidase family protein n=1 Tax=Streptomyces sp. ISL-11 TaxID=2819174 RepID=UPI001BE61168|nr:Ig-like domain-containing protein [Streptomyces sp. ISL-11]MBT2382979.1 L,D-transpeptidase family protein [Streptomyces sp. ISL-11]